jgi:hypothetical protein
MGQIESPASGTRRTRSHATSVSPAACKLCRLTRPRPSSRRLCETGDVNRSTAVQLLSLTRTIGPSPSTRSRSRAAMICFGVSKCRGIELLATGSIPLCASNRHRAFVPPPYPRKSAQFMGTQAKLCSTHSTVIQSNFPSKSVAYCTDLHLCCTQGEMLNGGGGRNRTGVHGFAVRCMATLPPRRLEKGEAFRAPPPELWSGKRVSNSRPQPWQGCALPTELFPQPASL